MSAPTKDDLSFHGDRSDYWKRTFETALKQNRITEDDRDLILQFVSELRAFRGISQGRQNKLVTHLVTWRYWIGPYRGNTMKNIALALTEIQTAKSPYTGRQYTKHVQIDYLTVLKQFYRWMIENELTSISEKDLKKIKVPVKPSITVTPDEMLTTDEVERFIGCCTSPRDWALFSVLYESGMRIGDLCSLTWRQVKIDKFGIVITSDFKTGKTRYIRLITARQPFLMWQTKYPFPIEPDNLVFVNRKGEPLTHSAVTKQMRAIALKAEITKNVHAHLFRHSRITHLIQQGVSSEVVGLMMWGDPTAKSLRTYLHLTGADIDREMYRHYGITEREEKVTPNKPLQCRNCGEIYPPGTGFCSVCGRALLDTTQSEDDELEQILDDPRLLNSLIDKLKDRQREIQ